ncbi:hypothetical protein BV898_07916 [Hypsibius exemplaris]|uniref:Protein F37C4.5 n=1 Tax=Hypsibius exemplaris TaxID=2072580 RepID=A0A1W0WS52_HYPEX|nr:hypothetical protein BV898_07916 [Hypsibius exemplaris]
MSSFVLNRHDVPITKVTVYPDCAEVQREWNGTEQLPEGVHGFSLTDLPGNIDVKSVRVSIKGGRSRILDIGIRQTESEIKEYQSQLKTLRKNEKTYSAKQAEVNEEVSGLNRQRAVWEKYLDLILKTDPGTLTAIPPVSESVTQNLSNFLLTYNEEDRKITEGLVERQRTLQKLDASLADNQAELAAWQEHHGLQTTVGLDVEVQESGQYTLTISYIVHNVSWTPSYDIYVTGEQPGRRMKVLYKAVVQQTTGEDWDNVRLILASVPPTEIPERSASLSEISSEKKPSNHLDEDTATLVRNVKSNKSQPEPTTGKSQFYANSPSKVVQSSTSVDMLPDATGADETVTEGLLREPEPEAPVFFEIAQATTVHCDNSDVLIDCAVTSIHVILTHHTIPNVSHHVRVTVSGVNSGEHIAAGPAKVFLDGTFTGTMTLPRIGRSDLFELPLGVDPHVRALIKAPQKVSSEPSPHRRGSTEVVKHAFEVTNSHDYTVTVSAVWDLKRGSGNAISTTFMDAPLSQPQHGVEKQRGTLNTHRKEVEWWIEIPAGKTHWATLMVKVERPGLDSTAGQALPEGSYASSHLLVHVQPTPAPRGAALQETPKAKDKKNNHKWFAQKTAKRNSEASANGEGE